MTKTVQGYRQGAPFLLDVVEVAPGHWGSPALAAALAQARAAFSGEVSIVSAWRSQEEQTRLHDAWRAYLADPLHAPKANPANPPGYSGHQSGQDVDLGFATETDREAFAAGPARDAGLSRPVAHEPWHFHLSRGSPA